MIDDIDTSNPDLWKYLDDTTVAENVVKTKASTIQNDVEELVEKSKESWFQLNEAKCKELRIYFAKHSADLAPIPVNGEAINVAHTVKLLGSVHKLRERGDGWFEGGGGPENFLHQKGVDLKCFQNTEVRTWNIWRVRQIFAK